MTVFIICHEAEPYFYPPDDSVIIWMNASKPKRSYRNCEYIQGYEFFESPEATHKLLAGTFGTMAILEHLKRSRPQSGKVTIWQYRKFVTLDVMGDEAPNVPGMYLVQSAAVDKRRIGNPELNPALEKIDDNLREFLVPRPLWIGNMSYQYSMFTPMVDFIRFIYLATEKNIISPEECSALCRSEYIIGGGIECGTYPVSWWVAAASSLIEAALAFASRFGPSLPDHPYHSRAASFCAERLGSYFLQTHLMKIGGEEFKKKIQATAASAYPAAQPRWRLDGFLHKRRLARKRAEFQAGANLPFATMHVVTNEKKYHSLGMQ